MIIGKYIPDAPWDGKLFTQPFPLVHVAIFHRENVGKQSIHGPAHLGMIMLHMPFLKQAALGNTVSKSKDHLPFSWCFCFFFVLYHKVGPIPVISRIITTINGRK